MSGNMLDQLVVSIANLKARVDAVPSFRWATVTSANPLLVQLDGDNNPLPLVPSNLAGALAVGQRVFTVTVARRLIVLGTAGGGGVPVGSLTAFAGTTVPAGWLLCDGGTYSKAAYPALAAVLGATGASFTVPDMRARVPLGAGTNGPNTSTAWGSVASGDVEFPLGESGGEYKHALTTSEMPAHDHDLSGHVFLWGAAGSVRIANATAYPGASQGNELYTYQNSDGWADTKSTGGGQPHNNLPPFRTVHWIIKAT